MIDYISEILNKLDIDGEVAEKQTIQQDNNRYILVEGENKFGLDGKILIFDCPKSNETFDFKSFKSISESLGGIFQLVIIFDNWDKEWEIMQNTYKKIRNAGERKCFLDLFEKKLSFYTDSNKMIELNVEGKGENYLEYCSQSNQFLYGRVYNLSFGELKKIFNVTGKELFRRNVRFGLRDDKTGNSLQLRFKEYIKIGAYINWINKYPDDTDDDDLKQIFDINGEINVRNPQNFWFYHNGITIYGNENIDFTGNKIKVFPKNISVINGAQTLTNFFEGIKLLPDEIKDSCDNFIDDVEKKKKIIEHVNSYLDEAENIMKVKTIFIVGKQEFLQPITYGLNTQIPILETDILADSSLVEEINKSLLKRNMKITKSGEFLNIEKMFSVLEFAKYYLISKQEPGRSKNLKRNDIKIHLKNAKNDLKSNEQNLLNDLYNINIIEDWWKKSKKLRTENYLNDGEREYTSYAKNYFEAFVLHQDNKVIDDDMLLQLYDQFIQIFMKINPIPTLSEFKNDKLYKQFLEKELIIINGNELKNDEDIDCEDLKNYLNLYKKNYYTIQKTILSYLDSKNKKISGIFRVVSRTNKLVREAFPFPNSTFSEIYQHEKVGDNKYKNYNESSFFTEVTKIFPVFIIDWDGNKDNRCIDKITYISDFTFSSLNSQAEDVYTKTIKAFSVGDEKLFPKMSDNLSFHVRPKATNAEDTFEFTNGTQITKRTFWANKNTMDKLIETFINKHS